MERLRVLRILVEILELFAGEIQYGKATLPECCGLFGAKLKEPFGSCLLEIKSELEANEGLDFGTIYQKRMSLCLRELPLATQDKECMLAAFESKEYADITMQVRAINRRRELLETSIATLSGELVNKCRMAVGLGAMSGLLLVIVLL